MSKIGLDEFTIEVMKELEIKSNEQISARICDWPEYDSMGRILVSLVIERIFGFQIDLDILDNVETIQSLYDYCRTVEAGAGE